MPGWVPFTALTLVVLLLLLALARISQAAVSESPDRFDETGETVPETTANGPERSDESDSGETDGPTDAIEAGERTGTDETGERMDTDETGERTNTVGSQPESAAMDRNAVTISGDVDTVSTSTSPETEREPTATREAVTDRPEFSTGALLANVALTQGVFGAILAVGAWYYEIPLSALGVTGSVVGTGTLAVGVGIVFGVLLWTGNEIGATVADAVGATYDESLREMLAPDSLPGWLLLLGVILPVIAGVEELLFRAALIGVPAAGFGISPWALAVVSSVAFAGGHGAQGKVGVAVTGGLGFVLAAGYILSGSLVVVVVAHYLVNALEFVVHEGIGAERVLG